VKPLVGSRGKAPGQGIQVALPPEAESSWHVFKGKFSIKVNTVMYKTVYSRAATKCTEKIIFV
jgi:hypothetical protein